MSTIPHTIERDSRIGRRFSLALPAPELVFLLLLAAVLGLWSLGSNGLANEYYSAAVRSMTTSWRNFFFGSFDGAGVMTVDKPPLALWVQAASVKVFGFSTWSMLVPQVLMSAGSVWLVYDMLRRHFGRIAGFSGGLVLTLTPISVAMARHNNPEAALTLLSIGAVWALVRGLEDKRIRWMVVSGVLIGLGFTAKMAAGLLVAPAIAGAWVWMRPGGLRHTIRGLIAWGASLTVTALAWPVAVWLTPAGSRPWISGTSDNSIWSLIFGYNGLGRLLGQSGGPGAGGGPGGGAGRVFGGDAGLVRLWNDALGGQASWLLGGALVAALGIALITRLRRDDMRTGLLIAAGGALFTIALSFSIAEGIFHPYYVALMAPFVALMIGAAAGVVTQEGGSERDSVETGVLGVAVTWASVLSSVVVTGASATALNMLTWPLLIAGAAATVLLLAGEDRASRLLAVGLAGAVLVVGPAIWSVQTLGHPTSSTFPAGGPSSAGIGGTGGGPGGPGGPRGPGMGGLGGPGGRGMRTGGAGMGAPGAGSMGGTGGPAIGVGPPGGGLGTGGSMQSSLSEALQYVRSSGGGTVAVSSQNGAASRLVAEGAPDLVALGGFSGRESQVTIDWLADAVESGRIRYVLTGDAGSIGGGGLPGDDRVGSTDAMSAAEEVGTSVSSVSGLIDLEGKADAIRARSR